MLEERTRELRASEDRLRALLDAIPDLMFILDRDGRFVDYHVADPVTAFAPPETLLGRHFLEVLPPEVGRTTLAHVEELRAKGSTSTYAYAAPFGAETRYFECRMAPCANEQTLVMVRDITDHKRAESEGVALQAQLIQAQKMESIGRLAGGVAHDFNNMLCVILGLSDLLLARTDPSHPSFVLLGEIEKAATRSAMLTRQLLAFARRQTITPKVLDLNPTVAEMLTMLQRLIGEDVRLTWSPGEDLWRVKVDPSQIDQILANLCVNARDAIAGVGSIAIGTCNLTVDAAHCQGRPGLTPNDYVVLSVTDDGHGMDEAVRKHIFEPFFTTKEVGKGTGLGLATVYGIVKQNQGWIDVDTEPGRGTTFRILLPRDQSRVERRWPEGSTPSGLPGQETILVVEDEPAILTMTTTLLQQMGYLVLAAGTPSEAARLSGNVPGQIDLILTDVILPEMNGRDLARALRTSQPQMRTLFMSGYAGGASEDHAILEADAHFLQKPFSLKDLAAKVREALDQVPGLPGTAHLHN
jgi:PAS domain S-box-containing protein